MGACLSSPYLLPFVQPVRHVYRAFATNLSKEVTLKFSNEISQRQSSGLNFVVWRRSALLLAALVQVISVIFAVLDASAVSDQTARTTLSAITLDSASFTASCNNTCIAAGGGGANQASYDLVCPSACADASTLAATQVTWAVSATNARYPDLCADPVAASDDIDTLRIGVDVVHAGSVGLSALIVLTAACNWGDYATSSKSVVSAFVVRCLAPYIITMVPWFAIFSDIDCPEFRSFASILSVAPVLCVLLSATPGLVRASRLMNTVAPKSAVPVLFMRVSPALHIITCWAALSLVYQVIGNVLLLVGVLVFTLCGLVIWGMSYTVEGIRSGRKLAAATYMSRWMHLLLFVVGGVLILVFAIMTLNDLSDTYGDVPPLLPKPPGMEYMVALGTAYLADFFIASVVFCDFIASGLMLLRNRDGYLANDTDMSRLGVSLGAARPSPASIRRASANTNGSAVGQDNPMHRHRSRRRNRGDSGDVEVAAPPHSGDRSDAYYDAGDDAGGDDDAGYDDDDGYDEDGYDDGGDDGAAAVRKASKAPPAPVHRAGSGIPPHARTSPRRTPRSSRRSSRSARGGRGKARGGSSRVIV